MHRIEKPRSIENEENLKLPYRQVTRNSLVKKGREKGKVGWGGGGRLEGCERLEGRGRGLEGLED